ncbi:type II toxin-antitoxin system HicA family toxin [Campylobacter coli]|nr:addiction module toxin, HicA family [Campylobacter coli]EAL5482006.1 hypothetical protein [Campylobacter jejuni]EAI7658642.1 addiction module toxin, HicA family [Campylobacter coli]EAI7664147.1 addiction module toxin, HicA family [Campylobacter coli]EAL6599765.1 addiction module toxin, HicA family [Campylobacter coli]
MPELPRMTAKEAEKLLLQNDFSIDRQKGSHRIYKKGLYQFPSKKTSASISGR